MDCTIEASRIAENLYQGSKPPMGPCLSKHRFDMVVLAAEEYQPTDDMFPGVMVVRAGINDGQLTNKEFTLVKAAAQEVAGAIRVGARVLVTCWMGWNRSGIVTACALHLLTGAPGKNVVRVVQSKRKNALSNRSFVETINRLPGKHHR